MPINFSAVIRARGLFRASLLVPMMLPTVVVGVVWRLLLHPNFGAINGTLKQIGINTENPCSPHSSACSTLRYTTLIRFVSASNTNDIAAAYPKSKNRNAVR